MTEIRIYRTSGSNRVVIVLVCLMFLVGVVILPGASRYLSLMGFIFGFYFFCTTFVFRIIIDKRDFKIARGFFLFWKPPTSIPWNEVRSIRERFFDFGLSITGGKDELHWFWLVSKNPKIKPIFFSGNNFTNTRGLLQDIVNHLPPDAEVDPNVIKFINSPYDKWEYLKITAWIVGIFALGFLMLYISQKELKAERQKAALTKQIQAVDQSP